MLISDDQSNFVNVPLIFIAARPGAEPGPGPSR
jgi:hypothetical protein